LESLDSQWHARPLGRIAATAVLAPDPALADRALALATRDVRADGDTRSLVEIAERTSETGTLSALERILTVVESIEDSAVA
jgi:hypothetical protein